MNSCKTFFECRLELLSPLHIGNGNELKMVDFYFDQKRDMIKFIDSKKFINYCIINRISLMEEINNKKYFVGKDFSLSKFMDVNKINPVDFCSYSVKAIIEKRKRESEFRIKEFVKGGRINANEFSQNPFVPDDGNPIDMGAYIPGSSIKGFIRTALMWKYLTDNDSGGKILNSSLSHWMRKYRITSNDLKRLDDEISSYIFGRDPRVDIFRSVSISDTNSVSLKKLEVSEVKLVGNSQDIPVYIETMRKNTSLYMHIGMDNILLDTKTKELNFQEHILRKYMDINIILKACNEFSKKILEKNLEFVWENYNCNNSIDEFDNIWNEVQKCSDNEAILHIGWGGGWYSTTIGLLLEKSPDFTTPKKTSAKIWELEKDTIRKHFYLGKKPRTDEYSFDFPKTKRVTVEGLPLGWVKITLES